MPYSTYLAFTYPRLHIFFITLQFFAYFLWLDWWQGLGWDDDWWCIYLFAAYQRGSVRLNPHSFGVGKWFFLFCLSLKRYIAFWFENFMGQFYIYLIYLVITSMSSTYSSLGSKSIELTLWALGLGEGLTIIFNLFILRL